MNLGDALSLARGRVAPREAKLLLREAAGASAAALAAFPERVLEAALAEKYLAWLARREAGEPIAYIVGWREFYGRRFAVSSAVLIPRPETELLVEAVLQRMSTTAPRILDLGTGSGAIAVSLACEAPGASVWALDASAAALAVARQNAAALGANVRFFASDWFAALAGERFDFIAANPPYIAEHDPHLAQGDLRSEPLAALACGADGLTAIRRIIAAAPQHLAPGACLLVEHGYDQAEAVRALFAQTGFAQIDSLRDLAGIARVTLGYWPASRV